MAHKLPSVCLNEIFEHLDDDITTLHSTLLTNHHFCGIVVSILWRDIWRFYNRYGMNYIRNSLSILSTLISCLPTVSRCLLQINGVNLTAPTSKSPSFNYISFIKVLSLFRIDQLIEDVVINQRINTTQSLDYNKHLIAQELLKSFMKDIPSLKSLDLCCDFSTRIVQNVPFSNFPGATSCLADLSNLKCSSNSLLPQTFQNIQSLTIKFVEKVSNRLIQLLNSQHQLKNLELNAYLIHVDWLNVIPALTRHYGTLTKLCIHSNSDVPLSFVSYFINLQELIISIRIPFEGFNGLKFARFTKLRIFKIPHEVPKLEMLIKFLENNGINLDEFSTSVVYPDKSLNQSLVRFCPNLKKLSINFGNDELETLKTIFVHCQYLESIKIWCQDDYNRLNGRNLLEVVVNHAPKNFYELKIYMNLILLPTDLEKFFISWKDRSPQKTLSLVIIIDEFSLEIKEEIINVIERYKVLGIIRKFEIKRIDNEVE
ncbi:1752_t:CDS:1 [Funneliformis geosporum]|uniref:1752_t:CDS:1 n=1 Tax=Funneliformis geosporum TaxID=1117311 RepID=A0A9W4WYC5_9GLOM|nr:1752_t:CDS:1 [Funneliformis geosporum]